MVAPSRLHGFFRKRREQGKRKNVKNTIGALLENLSRILALTLSHSNAKNDYSAMSHGLPDTRE
jgi:hypothetical protein